MALYIQKGKFDEAGHVALLKGERKSRTSVHDVLLLQLCFLFAYEVCYM